MNHLLTKGWKPCTDNTHKHPEGVLHPPRETWAFTQSEWERTFAPAEVMSFDEAVFRGLTGFLEDES